jgi:hypothetical protein
MNCVQRMVQEFDTHNYSHKSTSSHVRLFPSGNHGRRLGLLRLGWLMLIGQTVVGYQRQEETANKRRARRIEYFYHIRGNTLSSRMHF